MRLTPLRIQPIGNELAIAWSDGTESYLPLEWLRRHCPCAGCGGEPDVMGEVETPEVAFTEASFQLRSYALMGGYALAPTWQDGHNTGLYPYQYLRNLAAAFAGQEPPEASPA